MFYPYNQWLHSNSQTWAGCSTNCAVLTRKEPENIIGELSQCRIWNASKVIHCIKVFKIDMGYSFCYFLPVPAMTTFRLSSLRSWVGCSTNCAVLTRKEPVNVFCGLSQCRIGNASKVTNCIKGLKIKIGTWKISVFIIRVSIWFWVKPTRLNRPSKALFEKPLFKQGRKGFKGTNFETRMGKGAWSFCQLVISSVCHFINWSIHLFATLSTGSNMNLQLCQLVNSLICCFVNWSIHHFVNLSIHQFAILSTGQFIYLLFCQQVNSSILSFFQLVNSSICSFVNFAHWLVVLATCHFINLPSR